MARNKVNRRKVISTSIVLILFASLVAYITYRNHNDTTNIKKNLAITRAVINRHAKNAKGAGWFYYEFSYKRKKYEGSTSDRGVRDGKEQFIGAFLVVVFDSLRPNRSRILIEENDFLEYNLTMPADMNWTSRYIPDKDPLNYILFAGLLFFVMLAVKFMRS